MSAFFDLAKLKDMLQRFQLEKKYPKHVLVNLFPASFSEQNQKEDLKRYYDVIDSILNLQIHYGIPIFTISLGKLENMHQDSLISFAEGLLKKSIENQMNVTVFGKWYDMKGALVEALRKVNNESNEFDKLFVNICINYDGQEELLDAAKLLAKKTLLEKSDPDKMDLEGMKENLYSSYFIPPDLVIEPGRKFSGTFLWDSKGAQIVFLKKNVLEVSKQDIVKHIEEYSSTN